MATPSGSPLIRGIVLGLLVLSSTVSIACRGGSPTPAALAPTLTEADVPLIPRAVLFGNPERRAPRLSDDGMQLAFLAPVNGVMNVWVGPVDKPDAARPLTKDTSRGIRQYFWAYDNAHIVYLQDKGGDENWRVYSVNVASGTTSDLTPFEKVAAQIQGVSDRVPGEILVALNNRNPELHDIYRINVATGKRTLVQRNDKYAGFLSDHDFNIRFAQEFRLDGGMNILRRNAAGAFEPFDDIGPDDSLTTQPIGFDKTGQSLILVDSRARDTAAVYQQDIATLAKTLLAEDAYGGYATLVGLTFTPDIFAAGVDIVGPSNLNTLLDTIPRYWRPQIELFTARVGDNRTPEGRTFLDSRSPLGRVEKVSKPLLIGQGANDPRVKQAESDQIVKAMQAKGIPVTYVLFPDEGHGFERPENDIAFFAITEAFLARHLGGRFEPIGDAFTGSSVTIPQGEDLVPGLRESRQTTGSR